MCFHYTSSSSNIPVHNAVSDYSVLPLKEGSQSLYIDLPNKNKTKQNCSHVGTETVQQYWFISWPIIYYSQVTSKKNTFNSNSSTDVKCSVSVLTFVFEFTSGWLKWRTSDLTASRTKEGPWQFWKEKNGKEIESSSEKQGHAELERNSLLTGHMTLLLLGGCITWLSCLLNNLPQFIIRKYSGVYVTENIQQMVFFGMYSAIGYHLKIIYPLLKICLTI